MNTGAPLPDLDEAWRRVLEIQTKLHRWASDDAGRRFDDLFNLVTDPATLLVAWERVRTNRGRAPRVWMARPPTTSARCVVRTCSSPSCGPT